MKTTIKPPPNYLNYIIILLASIPVFFLSLDQYANKGFDLVDSSIIVIVFLLTIGAIRFSLGMAKLYRTIDSVNNVEVYIAYDCLCKIARLSQNFRELTGLDQEYIDSFDYLKQVIESEDLEKLQKELIASLDVKTKKFLSCRVKIKEFIYKISFVPILNNRITESILIVFFDITDEYLKIKSLEQEYQNSTKQEADLKLALDNLNLAVWIRDANGKIPYCNKYYGDLINYDMTSEDSYKELDKLSRSFADNCINEKASKVTERYLIVKGKRYLYQFSNIYIPESNRLISSGYNVSSKDEIAQELQRSIAAQSDLLESTSNACAIFGQDRVIKFHNNSFCKLWDIDEIWLNMKPKYEHLLDKLRDERKLPEYANYSKFRQDQVSLFSNLTESQNDFYYLPDGRSLKVVIVPHTFGGLLFSYEDITDKIALESSYNTLLDVQKATLENLHEAVCVFAENGRLRLINKTFLKMWKITDATLKTSPYIYELLDHSESIFRRPDELVSHKQSLLSVFSKRISTTERIELKDGSVISRLIVPLPDGATLISDIDITDSVVVEKSLREKNIALQEADRIKTEFLANVSYELRSPLTSIVGLSESLVKHLCGKLNNKQHEYVDGIRDSAEQLMLLINDMIDLTAVDAGYVELKVSKFNLYKAVNSIIPLVKSRMSILGLKLSLRADKDLIMLGDETRIRQVIFKLLNNAIDRSLKGQEIKIKIGKEDDNIILAVVDQGAEENMDNNKNAAGYEKPQERRSGFSKNINLSVIKTFVSLHGGQIKFENENGLKVICIYPENNPDLLSIYHSYDTENLNVIKN